MKGPRAEGLLVPGGFLAGHDYGWGG